MRLFEILCAGAMLAWNGTALAADATPPNIAEALASAGRPHTDILLDGQLKTAEVLAFAGVKPGQAAVQLLPETGYYARLLSLAVGSKGQLDIIVPMAAGPGMTLEQRREIGRAHV